MTTFTINHTIVTVAKRNGASVDVDTATLPVSIIADLLAYGIKQKVADASSAEPTTDGSQSAMDACVKTLQDGAWSMRGESTSSDPLDKYRLAIVRAIIAKPQNAKLKASYDAIDSSDQKARREFLLDLASKNAKAIDPVAKQHMQVDLDNAKAANSLDIAI